MELEPAEVEAAVNEFAIKLERLRVSYDQYFMGIVGREPLVQLKDIVRLLHFIDQQKIRNTRLRFRYRSTVQKFNSLRTQWNRILRQIEAGTYERDVARVRRKLARDGIDMPSVGRMRSASEIERAFVQAAQGTPPAPTPSAPAAPAAAPPSAAAQKRPAPSATRELAPVPHNDPAPANRSGTKPTVGQAPVVAAAPPTPISIADEVDEAFSSMFGGLEDPPPAPPRPPPLAKPPAAKPPAPSPGPAPPRQSARPTRVLSPPPPPTSAARLPSEELQSIYRRFIKAKQLCGEDTHSVKYEAVSRTIEQQLPKLRAANPGKDISFQVVIRQGRAVLKAVPKD